MSRNPKEFEPLDYAVGHILRRDTDASGMTRRELSLATGIGLNRLNLILWLKTPPASMGEVGALAKVAGKSASEVIREAESILMSDPTGNVDLLAAGDSAQDEMESYEN